ISHKPRASRTAPRDASMATNCLQWTLSKSAGLEAAVDAFEAAWLRGERPRLEDHLPPDGDPGRLPVLLELVHTALEFRLTAGEPAQVENYLERFPGLAHGAVL